METVEGHCDEVAVVLDEEAFAVDFDDIITDKLTVEVLRNIFIRGVFGKPNKESFPQTTGNKNKRITILIGNAHTTSLK